MMSKCACCGNKTIRGKIEDALGYICPVCYWEVDTFISDENDPSDQNRQLTLSQAQNNYTEFGAFHSKFVNSVRKPTVEEQK